jgi:hypothetical protein
VSAPHAAVDFILKNAPSFAAAKAKRVQLEEFRKIKKALLMSEALKMGTEAANAQERYAYGHPDYKEVVDGLAAAIEAEESLKWQMEAAKMRCDIWRTEEATNRMTDRTTQ